MSGGVQEVARGSAKGSFVLIIGQVASYILSAIGTIVVANFLGSYSLGEVTVVMVPANIAILLNDFGVNNALTKYIAQYRYEKEHSKVKKLLKAGFVFNFVSMSVSSAVMYLFAEPIAVNFLQIPSLAILVRAASLFVFGQGLLTMAQAIFVGYDEMGQRSISQVIWSLVKSVAPPFLVWVGLGPLGAVLGNVIASIIAGGLGMLVVYLLYRREESVDGYDYRSAFKLLLIYGFPLYLASLAGGGLQQFYGVLMTLYVEKDLIGNFNAAVNFGVIVSLFTIPLSTALFPLFSKMNNKREALGPLFERAVKYTSMVTTPVVLLTILVSDLIVGIIYPVTFDYTSFYLRLYLISFLFQGIGALATNAMLDGIGETRVHFKSSFIGVLLGIPMSVVLIPQFGIPGMIAAMIVAPRAGLIYELVWIKKNLDIGFDTKSSFSIYLSAGLAMAISLLPLYVLQNHVYYALVATSIVYLSVYIVLVLLTGGLTKTDLTELESITGMFGPLAPIVKAMLRLAGRLARG